MSKSAAPQPVGEPKEGLEKANGSRAARKAPADETTVEEFCIRESARAHRAEALGAFHRAEELAGRIKDTDAAFAERFRKFLNRTIH
jgi:hypothetical protein